MRRRRYVGVHRAGPSGDQARMDRAVERITSWVPAPRWMWGTDEWAAVHGGVA